MENKQWVTPADFDVDNISVLNINTNDAYDRMKVLYKYKKESEPKDLIITIPKNPEAYIKCKGVKKDIYGERRIETPRYGAQFVLSAENPFHNELYNVFVTLTNKLKELTNCEIIFPSSDYDNSTILYTNIIHSNSGKMFTTAYTSSEQLVVTDCRQCITRPALLVSLLKKSNTTMKLRLHVSQMFVYDTIQEFPLANLD